MNTNCFHLSRSLVSLSHPLSCMVLPSSTPLWNTHFTFSLVFPLNLYKNTQHTIFHSYWLYLSETFTPSLSACLSLFVFSFPLYVSPTLLSALFLICYQSFIAPSLSLSPSLALKYLPFSHKCIFCIKWLLQHSKAPVALYQFELI